MKKVIGLLAVCVSSYSFAQTTEPLKPNPNADTVELVSLDKMPIPSPPGEADKMRNKPVGIAADGFTAAEKAPTVVRAFFNHIEQAKTYIKRQNLSSDSDDKDDKKQQNMPEIYKNLSALKLSFKPMNLAKGNLVAAAPSGTKVNDAWTGVDRFFEIDGVGSVRFSELDMAASGGKFYMMKEAINTTMRGKPAISKIFVDDDGQQVEEVVWVENGKFYMLTFGPVLTAGTKQKASRNVTALSLAQELY